MNERYLEALQQYELELGTVRKGRSGWICETDQGIKLLKEYRGTIKRLEFESQVLGQVQETGYKQVDSYLKNKQDEWITLSEDGTRHVLKNWFLDRECNLKEREEIMAAVTQIAKLHKILRQIPQGEDWSLGSIAVEPMYCEMERHNKELQRAHNYMRGKRKKTEFELCVISNFYFFYQQAKEAQKGLKQLWEDNPDPAQHLCHGDLDHHHVLIGRSSIAIIEYNKMHLGNQMTDLYHFMRKAMEKHDWNQNLGRDMLAAYHKILPLTEADRTYLYYLFLYPEKYWKQINFYFNANKAWIPSRNVEKLCALEAQSETKNQFLSKIK
ncbi:MAG: spore coat protein CotS [Hungatella sp.]